MEGACSPECKSAPRRHAPQHPHPYHQGQIHT
jgi:hypothetical protein